MNHHISCDAIIYDQPGTSLCEEKASYFYTAGAIDSIPQQIRCRCTSHKFTKDTISLFKFIEITIEEVMCFEIMKS